MGSHAGQTIEANVKAREIREDKGLTEAEKRKRDI